MICSTRDIGWNDFVLSWRDVRGIYFKIDYSYMILLNDIYYRGLISFIDLLLLYNTNSRFLFVWIWHLSPFYEFITQRRFRDISLNRRIDINSSMSTNIHYCGLKVWEYSPKPEGISVTSPLFASKDLSKRDVFLVPIRKASCGSIRLGRCCARDTINISVRIIGQPRSTPDRRKFRGPSCPYNWSWRDYSRPLRGKPGIHICPGFQHGHSSCRTRLTISCFRIIVIGV